MSTITISSLNVRGLGNNDKRREIFQWLRKEKFSIYMLQEVEQSRVKKKELENIIEYKTKGAIIRSKARWYNEGEKNNKYFLNLENRHCKKKTIMQIKAKDGASLTNDSDILRESNYFYSDLYATKSTKITGDLEKIFLLKCNLETEKQISTVTDSQNKFQKKWHKILHAL